jgi:MFS family permease
MPTIGQVRSAPTANATDNPDQSLTNWPTLRFSTVYSARITAAAAPKAIPISGKLCIPPTRSTTPAAAKVPATVPATDRATAVARASGPNNIGLVFTLSLYLQLGAGQSALSTGLVLMGFALGTLLSAAASDPLTERLGRGVLLAGSGLLAAGIAAVLLALAVAPTPAVWWLVPGLAVAGIGNGLVIAPVTTVVLAGVDRRDAGAASGVLNTAQRIGQALGTALLGLVLFTALATALTDGATPAAAYTRAIELALLGALAAAAVTFALVFALPRVPHHQRGPHPATTP